MTQPVTKSKVRSTIQKVWWFLQSEHLPRGREEKSHSGSYRSHSQMNEKLAGTSNRAMREQIPRERKSIPDYSLGERRTTFVRQLVQLQKACKNAEATESDAKNSSSEDKTPAPLSNLFFSIERNYRCLEKRLSIQIWLSVTS